MAIQPATPLASSVPELGHGRVHRLDAPSSLRFRHVLLIVLSTGVHSLAFPPWNLSLAAWIALVPFLCALRSLQPAAGVLAGLLWGSAAIWAVAYWVPAALTFYYQQPWWFGLLFCVVGSMALWGSYYAVFGGLLCWLTPRTGIALRVLLLSTLWVSCELARARLLTGEPWMLLGYALIPNLTLIQSADLGGVYLLSFLVIAVNVSFAETVLGLQRRDRSAAWILLPAAALLAAAYTYGSYRLAVPLPDRPAVPVVVVQGNNDLGTQWREEFYGQGLERYLQMSVAAAGQIHPRLIVWPESAVTFFLAHEPGYQALITRMLSTAGADLIVGAPHYQDDDPAVPRFFNSAFYLTADGRLASRYDKGHLLPFAEYFPLRTIEFLRRHFERVRNFTAGDGATLLDTSIGKAAVVICFEAIFPELVRQQMQRGASLLVNLSNDAWLGRQAGPEQHLAMATLRAVENRTWLIRATTTGVSAIIDPFGRVRARSATFAPAVLDGTIVPMQADTFYKRVGDAFAYGCLLISLAGLLGAGVRRAARRAAVVRSRILQ